jgi:hypothetical protein
MQRSVPGEISPIPPIKIRSMHGQAELENPDRDDCEAATGLS